MPGDLWGQRFFATTRGQLLRHLRRGALTVDDLAQTLGLTDNAVRAQLALLERDGLVIVAGQRRTSNSRKPSQEYQLTEAAERLYPKPYDSVLRQLLTVLDERNGSADTEAAVREVGRRLAATTGSVQAHGTPQERLAVAAEALTGLGGLAEVVEADGHLAIHGASCPLAAVAGEHAAVCQLTEAFIGAVSGLTVSACCERTPTPRCRFDLAPA